MRQLPQNYPEIYDKFLKGIFVVKQNHGNFNAGAGDLKLEQAINRSQKSVGGIIGQTRQREYVTKWKIIYDEFLAISTCRGLTQANIGSNETNVHHELDKNFCKSFNTDVDNVYSYFTEKGNPYIMLEPNFYNITSKEIFSDIIVQKFLNVFCDGLQQYKIFREERYIQKIKKLSDTITKYNFSNLGHISKSDSEQKKFFKYN